MSQFEELRAQIKQVQSRHRGRPEMMHGMKVPYYRRGEMSIPGFRMKAGGDLATDGRQQSLRMMAKAATFPVDFFFYDLEDAAPDNPEFKIYARQFVAEALQSHDFGKRVAAFRPSSIRTAYFEDDVIEVLSKAGHKLQAMVIPKTEYAEEVADIVKIVRDVQRIAGHGNGIALEVLIESPRAFLEAEKIAALDGVAALVFGSWDFARTIGGKVTAEGWLHEQAVARQMLPIIAAACGKDAVDAVTATLPLRPKKPEGVSDEAYRQALSMPADAVDVSVFGEAFVEGLERKQRALELARIDAENARAVGYAAKWVLHPDQIEPIQGAWTPSRDEALAALKLTADYAVAAKAGSGAELTGNQLADKAVVGTEWWLVHAGLQAGILTDQDIADTGISLEELHRTVVVHDEHSLLKGE